jgi:hypothetical protein
MDGGSSINILYAVTFARMKLPAKRLQASKTKFHRIIPGTSAVPLGRISLDVVFGSKDNYRKEKCTFEVIDFDSPFHALFGRPAYAKFMARPCYIYSKLKIPGPKGVITISCNGQKAAECELGGSAISQLAVNRRELAEMIKEVDKTDMTPTKRPAKESDVQFEAAQDTKRIALEKGDSSKEAIIGANLSAK